MAHMLCIMVMPGVVARTASSTVRDLTSRSTISLDSLAKFWGARRFKMAVTALLTLASSLLSALRALVKGFAACGRGKGGVELAHEWGTKV
jgi:hypothetical protein